MKRITFEMDEHPGDYKHLTECLERVLFATCIHYLQEEANGIPPTRQDVDDIQTVRGLLEDMKERLTD